MQPKSVKSTLARIVNPARVKLLFQGLMLMTVLSTAVMDQSMSYTSYRVLDDSQLLLIA